MTKLLIKTSSLNVSSPSSDPLTPPDIADLNRNEERKDNDCDELMIDAEGTTASEELIKGEYCYRILR